jgi:hypothetical protein
VGEWREYLHPSQLGSVVFCDYWVFGLVTNRIISQVAQSIKICYPEATVILYNFRSRKFIEKWKAPDWGSDRKELRGRSLTRADLWQVFSAAIAGQKAPDTTPASQELRASAVHPHQRSDQVPFS